MSSKDKMDSANSIDIEMTEDLSTTTSDSHSTSRDQHVQVSRAESFRAFNLVSQELEEESKAFIETTGGVTEAFDLRAYLHDSQLKEVDGKPKHLGVSVKNLTVVGLAPENSIIANNLTPFLSLSTFFNPATWCVSFFSFLCCFAFFFCTQS